MRKLFEARVSTATGLLVIGAVLALVIGMAVRIRQVQATSSQTLAVNILKSLVDAQNRHRERHPRYAPDLDALGDPWSTRVYTDYDGYTHEVLAPPGDPTLTWAARATPVGGASWPHYYVDHTGVVRVEPGRPAGPASPPWTRAEDD